MARMNESAKKFSETLAKEQEQHGQGGAHDKLSAEHDEECILCHESHGKPIDEPWGTLGWIQHSILVWFNQNLFFFLLGD